MTVVIGYLNEHFSIIATDTRLSFEKNSTGDASTYTDRILKLRSMPYPLGWCAGSGFTGYIDIFKDSITKCYMRNIDEIKNICISAREKALQQYPDKLDDIENSKIFGSWPLNIDTGVSCEIGFIRFINGVITLDHITKNTYFIGYPADAKAEYIEQLTIKYDVGAVSHDGDLNQVINRILQIFNKISMQSSDVSRICEIGIQLKKGLRKLSLSGEIEELLKQGSIFDNSIL